MRQALDDVDVEQPWRKEAVPDLMLFAILNPKDMANCEFYIEDLEEKETQGRTKHAGRGDAHGNPREHRTRLVLHDDVIACDDENANEQKGGEHAVNDCRQEKRVHRIDAGKGKRHSHNDGTGQHTVKGAGPP